MGTRRHAARAAADGARWAHRALAEIRAHVDQDGLGVAVLAPPTVARGSMRGARIAMRLQRATCLERSLIVQRWLSAAGASRDIVIGVRLDTRPRRKRAPRAHAWVEGWDADCSSIFTEIRRVPAHTPRNASESANPADD